jgi:hypothetical protein
MESIHRLNHERLAHWGEPTALGSESGLAE